MDCVVGLVVRDGSSSDDVGDGNNVNHVAHKLALAPMGMQGGHGFGDGERLLRQEFVGKGERDVGLAVRDGNGGSDIAHKLTLAPTGMQGMPVGDGEGLYTGRKSNTIHEKEINGKNLIC